MHPYLFPFLRRLAILTAVSAILVLGISEVAYQLQREDTSRGPKTIELVIPAGTAEKVAAGQNTPSIPEEMIFVAGDVLLVRNQDIVDHQLGDMWIPAASTASMPLQQVQNYAVSCSFQSTRYLGLTVKQAVTWKSRLGALWYGLPPTVMFFLVYSFAVRPLKPDSLKTKSISTKQN